MVNELSDMKDSSAELSRDSKASEWLTMLEGWLMKLEESNTSLEGIELGIHTQTSTVLSVGSALYLSYPSSWSLQSREEMKAYGDQVSQWIRQKFANVATREEAKSRPVAWAIDKNESDDSLI